MSRLGNLRIVDPVLTSLSRGYKNAALMCQILFPVVAVEKEAGKIPQFGKEAFRIYQTLRGLRGRSNRINPEDYTSIPYVLDEHDLEFPIDYRERQEAANVLPLERWATNVVTQALALRCEKQCADLAQDLANYAATHKVTLAGNDKWATFHADSDPVGDIEEGKDVIRHAIGTLPNTMVMGYSTWKVLKQHPDIIDRIKYSERGIVTTQLIAALFEIETVAVAAAVYDDELGGAFGDLWGDNCILAYVPKKANDEERSEYEPSFGYTFKKREHPQVDTRVEDGKVELIRNTDIFRPYLVGAEAGYIINDTN